MEQTKRTPSMIEAEGTFYDPEVSAWLFEHGPSPAEFRDLGFCVKVIAYSKGDGYVHFTTGDIDDTV